MSYILKATGHPLERGEYLRDFNGTLTDLDFTDNRDRACSLPEKWAKMYADKLNDLYDYNFIVEPELQY